MSAVHRCILPYIVDWLFDPFCCYCVTVWNDEISHHGGDVKWYEAPRSIWELFPLYTMCRTVLQLWTFFSINLARWFVCGNSKLLFEGILPSSQGLLYRSSICQFAHSALLRLTDIRVLGPLWYGTCTKHTCTHTHTHTHCITSGYLCL